MAIYAGSYEALESTGEGAIGWVAAKPHRTRPPLPSHPQESTSALLSQLLLFLLRLLVLIRVVINDGHQIPSDRSTPVFPKVSFR